MAMERLLQAPQLRESFELRFLDISDRRSDATMGRFDLGNVWLALRHIRQFLGELVRHRADVVYLGISQGAWGYVRDLGFLLPALMSRQAIVIHLRGSEFDGFYRSMPLGARSLTRFVFRRVKAVIVLGDSLRGIFTGLVSPDRIFSIPNGINVQAFDAAAAPPPRTTPLSAAGTGRRILYLSNLRARKGIFEFLESIPYVRAAHPEVRITIAGEWRRDEERERAANLIDKHELSSCVTFTGSVSGNAKCRLYREHDVFVFPPVQPEGLPWVILEAMTAALPVVTTDQGAIRDVVEDGATGFIVKPEPSQLAERINQLLSHPDQARTMGLRGRTRVLQFFSEDVYFARICRVLRIAAGMPE